MSKELEELEFENPTLNLGFDYAKNGDIQCAVINLYYDGINHIIYDTTDKEQVVALNKIMQAENKKQQDLQRLEQIDNSQPSKALECLERMCKVSKDDIDFNIGWVFKHEIDTIKQALIKAQKQEKVLEIIFKKPLKSATTINYLKINQIFPDMLDYEHYCLTVKEKIRNTEEEFNTLKEVIRK